MPSSHTQHPSGARVHLASTASRPRGDVKPCRANVGHHLQRWRSIRTTLSRRHAPTTFTATCIRCPANTDHLYNICTTSTLVQHCTNVIQMFCVCWEAAASYEGPDLGRESRFAEKKLGLS